MKDKVYAWHFTNGMRYRDGTELVVGKPCKLIEDIELCSRGYHASENIIDALRYAPGTFLSRTEHSGVIYRSHDKLCSQMRTPLWTIDATNVLVEFAQACAAAARYSAAARYARYARYAADAAAADAAAAAADARYAALYADDAAAAAAAAAADAADAAAAAAAEREWQGVVLLQLISNEYDKLVQEQHGNT